MGSWAEGCCISDLEIAPNEPVVVGVIVKKPYLDLNSGAFGSYTLCTPLLRGIYDDYGGMDIRDTDENKAIFLKALMAVHEDDEIELGDNFSVDDVPTDAFMWMARLDALEMLRTIRHEFVWNGAKRVGESEQRNLNGLSQKMANITGHMDMLQMWDRPLEGMDQVNKTDMKVYTLATHVLEREADSEIPAVKHLLEQILADNSNEDLIKQSFVHIAEIQMMRSGLGELRKALRPLVRTGPQYDGWLAVADFTKYLNQKLREQRAARKASEEETRKFSVRFEKAKAAFTEMHGREPTTQPEYQEALALIPSEE